MLVAVGWEQLGAILVLLSHSLTGVTRAQRWLQGGGGEGPFLASPTLLS